MIIELSQEEAAFIKSGLKLMSGTPNPLTSVDSIAPESETDEKIRAKLTTELVQMSEYEINFTAYWLYRAFKNKHSILSGGVQKAHSRRRLTVLLEKFKAELERDGRDLKTICNLFKKIAE